jgi:hypothetical protein
MVTIKCPKCGNEGFLVRLFIDLLIDPNTNFGNIKYDWIEKCTCANVSCGHDLKDDSDEEIKISLLSVAKRLLEGLRNETLLVK